MSIINAFSRVLNQKAKARCCFFMDFKQTENRTQNIQNIEPKTGGLGISYSSRKMRGKVLNFI
jgi:hypothetical protein